MPATKTEIEWIEIPIFIHGITNARKPGVHKLEYDTLRKAVNEQLVNAGKPAFKGKPIYVEWGKPSPQADSSDRYLAGAERIIVDRVQKSMGRSYKGPLGLYGGVRDIIFYGVSDLFYYVSSDGEESLRNHVFSYVARQILKKEQDPKTYYSLTIFAHSAGSIISHDLLFHLFGKKNPEKSEPPKVQSGMDQLRSLIGKGRLRIRHLYTFGSPIVPVMLRADSLIQRMRAKQWLIPASIGLLQDDQLAGPRWVNFWERDDPASYPVAAVYDNSNNMIEDHELHLGPIWKDVHDLYWGSTAMAKAIAKNF